MARPIRQLSLQQPMPHRFQVRQQRSMDDYDKFLQIYASSIACRKLATNTTESKVIVNKLYYLNVSINVTMINLNILFFFLWWHAQCSV